MAKCVIDKKGAMLRVSDDEAAKIVKAGGKYIGKYEWKRVTRAQKAA